MRENGDQRDPLIPPYSVPTIDVNRFYVVYSCHVFKRFSTFFYFTNVFTALHGMPARTSYEKAVRPSVCPSVKRVDCDKTEESSVQIFTPYERSFSLVLREEEWLVGLVGDTFYLKFWVKH